MQDAASERERGRELMEHAAGAIVDGVERLAPAWVVRVVTRVADVSGVLDEQQRAALLRDATGAGEAGAARVAAELRALFSLPPEHQHATPLEIVRSLRHEATGVLARAGVPEVARDRFEQRAFPDDVYGIVPRSLADLGDDELGPLLLMWGLGKTRALRGSM